MRYSDQVVTLWLAGVKRSVIAERLQLRKGQIAGALWRHRNPGYQTRYSRKRKDDRRAVYTGSGQGWTDRKLTESWAERQARRAAEKGVQA